MAPAANSIARNSRPLPRNTVAKNWSSRLPKRSRKTPMNHKKASPANGTRFNATATRLELVLSHSPGSNGSVGTEIRSSQKTARSNTQNKIPAIAAAFGVFQFARVMVSSSVIVSNYGHDAHGLEHVTKFLHKIAAIERFWAFVMYWTVFLPAICAGAFH